MRIKVILQNHHVSGVTSQGWAAALDEIVLRDFITAAHFRFLAPRWRIANPTQNDRDLLTAMTTLVVDCRDKLRSLTQKAGVPWPPAAAPIPPAAPIPLAAPVPPATTSRGTQSLTADTRHNGAEVVNIELLVIDPDVIDPDPDRDAEEADQLRAYDEQQAYDEQAEQGIGEPLDADRFIELLTRVIGKTDGARTFEAPQRVIGVELRESEVSVINLIQPVRRAFPGREVRAMYGALFPNAANMDWSRQVDDMRPYLENDRCTRLWFLQAQARMLQQYTVGVILYRVRGRAERDNTPTTMLRPHLSPADYPDFDSDEP
jgi:hypothetical protein